MEQINNNWSDIIKRVHDMHCKNNIRSVISKIGTAACVYNIWHERNLRSFQNVKRNEDVLISVVKEEIKWKLISLNVRKSGAVIYTYKLWDIEM